MGVVQSKHLQPCFFVQIATDSSRDRSRSVHSGVAGSKPVPPLFFSFSNFYSALFSFKKDVVDVKIVRPGRSFRSQTRNLFLILTCHFVPLQKKPRGRLRCYRQLGFETFFYLLWDLCRLAANVGRKFCRIVTVFLSISVCSSNLWMLLQFLISWSSRFRHHRFVWKSMECLSVCRCIKSMVPCLNSKLAWCLGESNCCCCFFLTWPVG